MIASLNRKPTRHTVFMLNRLINETTHKEDYLLLMNDIVHRNDVEQEIKDDVQEFLDFQKEME